MNYVSPILIVGVLLTTAVKAQEVDVPIVEIALDETTIVPGQYTTMRVTVLVPTWLSQPVVFPSFELPDLRVRLGDESTTAVSRLVEGTQWSGVSRRYAISPMVSGQFQLPPQDLQVSYADPGKPDPVEVVLQTNPVRIAGVLPEGGEALDPFIAGDAVTLTQEISGSATSLKPGDSVVRTVMATIDGASPIVLPPLIPEAVVAGVRAYPGEPRVEEIDEEGELSGKRIERTTYMAESEGAGTLPAIELTWFNLQTNQIETAVVPGFDISIEGTVGSGVKGARRWLAATAAIVLLLLIAHLAAGLRMPLMRMIDRSRQRRQASKSYMKHKLLAALRRHDFAATVNCLQEWSARAPQIIQSERGEINRLLLAISSHLYGPAGAQAPDRVWDQLAQKIRASKSVRPPGARSELPPLNPMVS